MVDYKKLGCKIKRQREQARMTQAALAEKMDVSISYISQVERGVAVVSLKRLDEIAGHIGSTTYALLNDSNTESDILPPDIAEKLYALPPFDQMRLLSIINAYINPSH